MSFRDNLIHMRAVNNMTQEQLAMLLGVSRQSVTKWESEKSYPEMDKLLKMCQIFNCTLDEIVQGDLTGRKSEAAEAARSVPADVFGYDAHMRSFASRISSGVMAIILGVAFSILFFSSEEDPSYFLSLGISENVANGLGVVLVLAGVTIGISFIIPAAMAHSHFVRSHPYIEDFYTEEERTKARNSFSFELISGIVCIFIGICAVIIIGATPSIEIFGVALLLVLIAVGVKLIVYGSMVFSRMNIAEYNNTAAELMEEAAIGRPDIPEDKKRQLQARRKIDMKIGAVCATIMITATIVGLLLLFLPSMGAIHHDASAKAAQSFFWLAWPIGGLLCGIVSVLMRAFASDED